MAFLNDIVALGGACALWCGSAFAQPSEPAASRGAGQTPSQRPVLVEMFLSQACSASPPAAKIITALAARDDVVALTWHVDYWNSMPAKKVGVWNDPFAHPEFGARQIAYNARIRGRAAKMTPQAIIDGFISVAGSKPDALEQRIVEAQFYDEKARTTPPALNISRSSPQKLRARIDGIGAPYDAILVNFDRKVVTPVTGGDNAGVTFREANVVRTVEKLAVDRTGAGEFDFEAPAAGLDCAVLVQERNNGRVVAARYCSK